MGKSTLEEASSASSSRLQRWHARWEENKIGWHEENVHEAILKYGDRMLPSLSSSEENNVCATRPVRVLFPLCGKSVDMAYFAKQLPHNHGGAGVAAGVVGVDGIRTALDAFIEEFPELEISESSAPDTEQQKQQQYDRLEGRNIMLLRGDFFGLDEFTTDGRFEAIFDRASLVAIEPTLREEYVQTIGRLIQPGGKIMLVVIERITGTDEDKEGPPFSVPELEVRRLYEGREWVESVELLETDGEKERNAGRGMRSLFFLIHAK